MTKRTIMKRLESYAEKVNKRQYEGEIWGMHPMPTLPDTTYLLNRYLHEISRSAPERISRALELVEVVSRERER